eukprot:1877585-Prymnesium_polylepis.1
METARLHALHRSRVVWAARQVSLLPMALQSLLAGGKPVNIVQNLSGDLIDGGAEPHYDTDDVADRAGCLDVDEQCAGQLVLRGARSRSSHRLVG